MMKNTQVLIIGAGPTGLVLALLLTRMGVKIRIIDKTSEPGTTSRAIVVHARTLEFYRQLGIADKIIEAGSVMKFLNLWVAGERKARVSLELMGKGISPYPFAFIYPQDLHEKFLISELAQLGIQVERSVELTAFKETADGIESQLRHLDGKIETVQATFIAGCDGAHSKIREVLRVKFPGGTYNHLFYVADIVGTGSAINGELNVAIDSYDFLGVFPLQQANSARLIGVISPEAERSNRELGWADVSPLAIERLKIQVQKVNWFSTYRVHHRVTEHFRKGRAFLLGDAAHIHSPVGGQGMNTGIGDAVNLAWKLADVLSNRSNDSILDSYEIERIGFARRLVATTDRAFQFVLSRGPIARFVRLKFVPKVIPALFQQPMMRRLMFRTLSQTVIEYRKSPLSQGQAGVSGGDRLPWVKLENGSDNFEALKSLTWQVHVYGQAKVDLVKYCEEKGFLLRQFYWTKEMAKADFQQNASYLVRPDGYIAFADREGSADNLGRYLSNTGVCKSQKGESFNSLCK